MLFADIDHAPLYVGMHALFARAMGWLRRAPLLELPTGKSVIDGERLFALVEDYTPRDRAAARWEAHRRYWDIQTVARGRELMGVAPVASLALETPYDASRDIAFFTGTGDFVTLAPGRFLLLSPHDAHAPGLSAGDIGPVRKVVLKFEMPA